MSKTLKYNIYDVCGNKDMLNVSKEYFIDNLIQDIRAYVDVCSEENVIKTFTDLAVAYVEKCDFSLNINGYLYTINEVNEMPEWTKGTEREENLVYVRTGDYDKEYANND